jgi:pyridinium-3,5-biscarboxylic acid mononucleotide sulfurtransferase
VSVKDIPGGHRSSIGRWPIFGLCLVTEVKAIGKGSAWQVVTDRHERIDQLRTTIRSLGKVALAYSGGVDSSLLLRVARDELGGEVLAIIVTGDLMPASEKESALATARSMGVEPLVLVVDTLSLEEFRMNPPDRCYICKRAIFTALIAAAHEKGFTAVIDGSHAGDLEGDRPGRRALRELGVRSPLAEAGLDKADVRRAAKMLSVPTAEKPANPCLATRIPFHEPITLGKLQQVDRAELAIHELGIEEVRVRHHGAIARIEVLPEDFPRVMDHRERIVPQLKALGFTYVVLDLQGFRSGSMSEVISAQRP